MVIQIKEGIKMTLNKAIKIIKIKVGDLQLRYNILDYKNENDYTHDYTNELEEYEKSITFYKQMIFELENINIKGE